jgi:hypothetical protein
MRDGQLAERDDSNWKAPSVEPVPEEATAAEPA